ncbi:MAG TPA: zinc ribbon domain-containing protein [Pyrinomonadaceae bacterium]|nr:zinc ribbon domain-containing protein [Pyrinomonadaceae bacterium]
MQPTCDYCHGASPEGAARCSNCGAPFSARAVDFRRCPHCSRRLLALGSPACNYCGKPLPENYIRAREAMWQRINEATARGATREELEALERDGDDAMRRALRSLFRLGDVTRRD